MFRTLSESSVSTSDGVLADVSATEAELPGLLLHTSVDSMQTDPSYRSQAVDVNEAPTENAGALENALPGDNTPSPGTCCFRQPELLPQPPGVLQILRVQWNRQGICTLEVE